MKHTPVKRHWLLVGIACVAVLVMSAVWFSLRKPQSLLVRAEELQVGQHISEVEQIMGWTGFARPVGPMREIRCFGPVQDAWARGASGVQTATGKSLPTPAINDFPVVVQFDPRTGRVFRIKRGEQFFGTTHAPSLPPAD